MRMARVSIYVPDEMKTRMDEVGELNWSAVAQRAFEIEINSQRWKMETDAIERAAARLRTSREKYLKEQHLDGKASGRAWALDHAEYRALKAVADHDWAELPEETYASWLCALAHSRYPPSEEDVKELWETLLQDRFHGTERTPEFVKGYIEGALEVWDEVADKI
jgi:hypothetical protein